MMITGIAILAMTNKTIIQSDLSILSLPQYSGQNENSKQREIKNGHAHD